MTDREWAGAWWPAEEPDKAVPGVLHHQADGHLQLRLIGGFDVEIRTPLPGGSGYSVSMEWRDYDIIHGHSNGVDISLLRNTPTHSSGGLRPESITEQHWSSTRALLGIHLEALLDPVFDNATLQFERLLQWSTLTSLEIDEDNPVGLDQRVGRKSLAPLAAGHEDMTFSLQVRSSPFYLRQEPLANMRSAQCPEWAYIRLSRGHPVPFDNFDLPAKDLQDLLTLSSYAPCATLKQSLGYHGDGAGGRHSATEVEVLGRQIYQPSSDAQDSAQSPLLFDLSEISFEKLVPNWFRLKSRARTACNVMFGLRYIASGYVGTRLLAMASSAESLHRAIRPANAPLNRTEYRRIKRLILDAVRDEDGTVVEFVNRGLQNNLSYYSRMLDLASIPDQDIVDLLLTDREQWAKMLKDARHNLAHANERSSSDKEHTMALRLLELTLALMTLVLMAELDLGPDAQRRVVTHPRVLFASHEFKKYLSST